MSKRKSQTAIDDYIAQGFVQEALVNYLALLGWSTGTEEEILPLDELVERFDIKDVHKGGAVFDRERLEWMNGQWIRRLSADDLIDRLRPFVEAELVAGRIEWMPTDEELRALLPVIQERLPTLGAIGDLAGFLWVGDVDLDPAMLVPKRWDIATAQGRTGGGPRDDRGRRRRVVRGGRARAAAARPGRRARLEGRRPVHGDPRRRHRPDRDAAAVRHARRPRPRARRWPGSIAPAPSSTAREARAAMTRDDVQRWLDRYVAAWAADDPEAIGDLFTHGRALSLPPIGRGLRRA